MDYTLATRVTPQVPVEKTLSDYIKAIQLKVPEEKQISFGEYILKVPNSTTDEQLDYIKTVGSKLFEGKPKVSDPVNPKHYDLFPEQGIQVRELMQVLCKKLDDKEYSGFLASDYVQAMQYFLRWFDKGGATDIEKGIWYMQKIIEQLKEKENI